MVMPDSEALLIKTRIETAFDAVPYPGDDNISIGSRSDTRTIALRFKGVRWQKWKENPSLFLRMDCQSALFLMTDAAFHYYLPLFMIQALLDYQKADVLSESIFSNFTEPHNSRIRRRGKPGWAQAVDDYLSGNNEIRKHINGRYRIMNKEQLQAILQFMEYIKRKYGHTYGWPSDYDNILERLRSQLNP